MKLTHILHANVCTSHAQHLSEDGGALKKRPQVSIPYKDLNTFIMPKECCVMEGRQHILVEDVWVCAGFKQELNKTLRSGAIVNASLSTVHTTAHSTWPWLHTTCRTVFPSSSVALKVPPVWTHVLSTCKSPPRAARKTAPLILFSKINRPTTKLKHSYWV